MGNGVSGKGRRVVCSVKANSNGPEHVGLPLKDVHDETKWIWRVQVYLE